MADPIDNYAHTRCGRPPSEWEPLEEHLARVRDQAGKFADAFGAKAWGELAGWWHDLGKYQPAFQAYLVRSNGIDDPHWAELTGRVDHSSPGAWHAIRNVKTGRLMLAHVVAGHHSGLLDTTTDLPDGASLMKRLEKEKDAKPFDVPAPVAEALVPPPPKMGWLADRNERAFQMAFWCRMLFSTLVDADFLATETFMNPGQSAMRPINSPTMEAMRDTLDGYLAGLNGEGRVNEVRRDVLKRCVRAATERRGLFSLTVPTGGGKTLSSLAFALHHATTHQLRRVIYAIQFTSIIEQNADVFRRALGPALSAGVLEHHGNVEPDDQTPMQRLAAENWDAPLVVTTNVQLLESLFACRTSKCRKLHRIAGSVIILDEAQSMPTELIASTLAALQELVRNYGCSIILCTATQPAVTRRADFPIGLQDVREIVGMPDEVRSLFDSLRRTEIEVVGKLSNEELIRQIGSEKQALCVVNTRKHAAELFLRLKKSGMPGVFHLSTRMCAAHRTAVLDEVRQRLADGRPSRIISTSLIEAGVDIDLPVVYRAMAGLDSIIQAAGRCNRNGRPERGRVVVFETDAGTSHEVAQAAGYTREVLPDYSDPAAPEAVEQFFRLRLWKRKDEWDKYGIMNLFRYDFDRKEEAFQFATAAREYRLIRQETVAILVPWGDGKALIERIMRQPTDRELRRRLQRYAVSVRPDEAADLVSRGVVETRENGMHVLLDARLGASLGGVHEAYDECVGLLLNDELKFSADVGIL